jgi:hypothetical protein
MAWSAALAFQVRVTPFYQFAQAAQWFVSNYFSTLRNYWTVSLFPDFTTLLA